MEPLGILILRLTFGVIFVLHGVRQAFGWIGGGHMEAVMERLGLRPPKLWAALSGFGNLIGGLLIALGLFTFLGCALLVTTMIVAIATIKGPNGFWEREGGYEYNLAVIGAAAALGVMGPGPLSLDASLAPELVRPELFFVAVAVCLIVAGLGLVRRTVPNT
jgi:putative oxidoreductase